jgi:uncharacterized protein YhbP (UPF0306 family)
MSVEELVRQYLPTKNIMQLATATNGSPWACNLHYYNDDNLNFYWLSPPHRRHSVDLKENPQAAAVVMVHENNEDENYIIGISFEGTVEIINNQDAKKVSEEFGKKHSTPQKFLDKVLAGDDPHQFYKLTPTKFVLFDTKNFKDDPRQEWTIA